MLAFLAFITANVDNGPRRMPATPQQLLTIVCAVGSRSHFTREAFD